MAYTCTEKVAIIFYCTSSDSTNLEINAIVICRHNAPPAPPTWVISPGGRLLSVLLWWAPLTGIVAGIIGGVAWLLLGRWTAVGWGVGLAVVAWRGGEGGRR